MKTPLFSPLSPIYLHSHVEKVQFSNLQDSHKIPYFYFGELRPLEALSVSQIGNMVSISIYPMQSKIIAYHFSTVVPSVKSSFGWRGESGDVLVRQRSEIKTIFAGIFHQAQTRGLFIKERKYHASSLNHCNHFPLWHCYFRLVLMARQ